MSLRSFTRKHEGNPNWDLSPFCSSLRFGSSAQPTTSPPPALQGHPRLPLLINSPVNFFHANTSSSKSFHLKQYYSARQLAGLSDSSEVEVSTLAGTSGSAGSTNGVEISSQFNVPMGVAISADGTYALVADLSNLIRRINIATASVHLSRNLRLLWFHKWSRDHLSIQSSSWSGIKRKKVIRKNEKR
jgi:hypothetical protein